MFKKLQEIAHVNSGYSFRKPPVHLANGDIVVVQGKNAQSDSDIIIPKDLTHISSETHRNPYFLEHNDILLAARASSAQSFRAVRYTLDNSTYKAISSSSFYIIRITDISVLPKYLSIFLNSREGQKVISQIVVGATHIRSIFLKNLLEIPIPIPPLHVQKSLIALHENMQQQERISVRRNELKKTIINATISNITKQ